MKQQYSISDAKNQLPAIIHGVEAGESAQLTRHGKPVAVLLSLKKYNALKQKNKNFWASLTSFRDSLNQDTQGVEGVFDNLRNKSTGRDFRF